MTSSEVSENEVRAILREAVPASERIPEGSVEVVSYRDWYGDAESFDGERVIRQWIAKLDEAVIHGYAGLRVTSPAAPLDERHSPQFVTYERQLDAALCGRHLIALCTYPLDALGAPRMLDVLRAHHLAVTRRADAWRRVATSGARTFDDGMRADGGADDASRLLRENEKLRGEIAERQHVVEALRESESEYRTTIEFAHDVIVFEDAVGNVIDVNRRAEHVTGYSRHALRRMNTVRDLVHPDDRSLAEAALHDLRAGHTREYQLRWRTKDRRVVYLDVSSVGRFSVLGEFLSTVCTLRDITERTEAEAAAREQQTLAEALRDTAAALNSTLDFDALLDQILDSVGRVVPHDAASIALRDGALWRVARHRGFAERGLREWIEELTPAEQQRLMAMAMPGGERTLISFCRAHPDWRPPAEIDWIGSHVSLPIRTKGRLAGILNVESTIPGFFIAPQLERLQSFADQAAIALDNARLLGEVRAGRARLQTLSNQLLGAQEAERRTLARELHDEIGQVLTAVGANLRALQLTSDPATLRARLAESLDLVDDAMTQVRGLSLDLRPSLLDDFGLVPALDWFVARVARRSELATSFAADPELARFAPSLETTLFRVAQIALTNTARHAQATRMRVELGVADGHVELVVADDGIGFDVDAAFERAAHGGSLGLLSMDERVRLARGTLTITSSPAGGTQVRARFPIE